MTLVEDHSMDELIDQYPKGLRVLAVDDDQTCLMILETLLRRCQYHVTATKNAITALKLLRENKSMFDLVISDVHMPDMDGFKLLELVGLEMDLPVIMLSVNDDPKMVRKGVTHGACDYLLKPVRIEALKNIWQHVIRKKKVGVKERNIDISKGRGSAVSRNSDQSGKSSKKRKDQDEDDDEEEHGNDNDNEDSSTQKKPRVVWSVELHSKFVSAVNQLGIEKAVPKRILELMNVEQLTRENVASHLQKYRLYLKRISCAANQQANMVASFGTADSSYMRMRPLNGIGHLHQLNGPQQFNSNAFRSFPLGGMIGRLNTPAGLNLHAQNLNISINDPLKFHASIGIDQLQHNKGVSVNAIQNLSPIIDAKPTFFMSNKSSPVFDISNNALILRAEGAEDAQGSGVYENLTSLASPHSQFSFPMLDHGSRPSDIWSSPVQSSATNSYPPNETLQGGNLSGASSITSMSNQSHDSLTEMHSQGLIFTNNSGQISNNVPFQGWDEHNHDSSYHANIIGNSIDSLIDPECHNSINSTYNRNLDFTLCDPLPMKLDGTIGLIEENSLKQQQDNIINQQKPQNNPGASNVGSLEDLASSMMKQKQDKEKLLDGSYSCNNN